MPALFPPSAFQKGFSGVIVNALDDGIGATTYAFPTDTYSFAPNTGADTPDTIDNSSEQHNVVYGINLAQIAQAGPLQIDRGMAAFLTAFAGIRTGGKLPDYINTQIDYSGATGVPYGGIWLDKYRLSGAFGQRGAQSQIRYELASVCLDPNNALGATAAGIPAAAGTPGTGISTFGNTSFTNGAASSPVIYDGIRSFDLNGDNRMTVDPSVVDPVNRRAAGCTPGSYMGMLTLTQLKGAVNPIPTAQGQSSFNIILKSADATHTLTIALSLLYKASLQSRAPLDYNQNRASYQVFGTSTVNGTGAAGFPALFTYV